MNQEDFDRLLQQSFSRIDQILNAKAEEYANDENRLHNFMVAAKLQGITPKAALGGMLAKHIVSTYDMIGSTETYSLKQWDEKIFDAINYYILLRALIADELSSGWLIPGVDFPADESSFVNPTVDGQEPPAEMPNPFRA